MAKILNTILALGCWLLTAGIVANAAPPLRGLQTMKQTDSSVIVPAGNVVTPHLLEGYCRSQAAVGSGLYLQHSGAPRILTILAAFQDVGFTVNYPEQAFYQYLNGEVQENLGNSNHLNLASVRRYYEVCSRGRFSPQFDVVGPVVLPQKMRYYGGSNDKGSDDRFYEFCRDAMNQAKPLVSDWNAYDNDQDGRAELVCIIYAGFRQNQGGADSTLWAKAATENLRVTDDLTITRFNCCAELFHPQYPTHINGTGVFIHELSHCMGLPDLYATSERAYVNNQGMETWSIMDYGLYNRNGYAPCAFTAWEQAVMGWTEMEDVAGMMVEGQWQVDGLLPVIDGGKAYKMVNSDNDRDYIVMENVQRNGLNQYASGHGLLVYHVDYPYASVNMSDNPNNKPGHPSVAVVPAGGTLISSYLRGKGKTYSHDEWLQSLGASVFPGTSDVTTLDDRMALPNYCFYAGSKAKATGLKLSEISESAESGMVHFVVSLDKTSGVAGVMYQEKDHTWYTLDGRRLHSQPSTRGVYIHQGRKVVIR